MAAWDDEDFDVDTNPSNGFKGDDKWEGEDEEVADAWDIDEDEEKKEETPGTATASDGQKKRRKNLKEVIKEKEEKRLEEISRKKAAIAEAEKNDNMTPEEIRRAQEESDLLLAKEAFGVTDSTPTSVDLERSIDHQEPKDKEGFDKLHGLLREKLLQFEKSPHYPLFLENTLRDLSVNQDIDTLRKLSNVLGAMANEKVKQQKGKSKKKGAAKGKIATIRENDFVNDVEPVVDEFDDFF